MVTDPDQQTVDDDGTSESTQLLLCAIAFAIPIAVSVFIVLSMPKQRPHAVIVATDVVPSITERITELKPKRSQPHHDQWGDFANTLLRATDAYLLQRNFERSVNAEYKHRADELIQFRDPESHVQIVVTIEQLKTQILVGIAAISEESWLLQYELIQFERRDGNVRSRTISAYNPWSHDDPT